LTWVNIEEEQITTLHNTIRNIPHKGGFSRRLWTIDKDRGGDGGFLHFCLYLGSNLNPFLRERKLAGMEERKSKI